MKIININIVLLFLCAFLNSLHAAPLKLLAIGDSLSDEYFYQTPYSAPDNNPSVANVKNWVELLVQHRTTTFSMGTFSNSYLDLRIAGNQFNFSIPGSRAVDWKTDLNKTYTPAEQLVPENQLKILTRTNLLSSLPSVNAVIIFLGANDLNLANTDAQNEVIRQNIIGVHTYVRSKAPANIPIIIATVPDTGVTPLRKIADPTQAATARQRVVTLNSNIASLSSLPNTYIARIDLAVDRALDNPLHINGTPLQYLPNPQNPPLHLFCKDGFHASTVSQAFIANEILKAINTFATTPVPLFTNREILQTILSQNPDQPYLDWAGSAGSMTANPDGDSSPNLVEFLLDSNPNLSDGGFTFLSNGTASYTPSAAALRFADLTVQQSTTLQNDWTDVPAENIQVLPSGAVNITPSGSKRFYRFSTSPKP
jgi:lysophospholipase L1-like esterase